MKEIQVGKVMLTFKGEYDSTKAYTRLDAVVYQGSSYVCLSDTSSTPPGDNWQLLAQKGSDANVDLTPYAKKADLNGLAKTSDIPSLNGYAKLTDLPSLDGYAKTSVFDDYYNKTETDEKLADKADKSELPDLSGYAKKSDIPSAVDLTGYAKKSDIPSLSGYAKLSDIPSVSSFLKQADLAGYVKTGDLVSYAKLSDLPAPVDTSSFATNSALSSVRTTAQSASNAASSAQSTARVAQNTANNAESRAESAYSLASAASSDAKAATQVPVITSGTLADLADKQGVYHYEIDFWPSDGPDTRSWGYCDVTVSEHYAREIYTAASDGGSQYIRTRDWGSSTWSDWRQITLWN